MKRRKKIIKVLISIAFINVLILPSAINVLSKISINCRKYTTTFI